MPNPMPPAPSRSVGWICLLLAALTAAAFYPVLRNGFVNWDDMEHVARNPDMNPPTIAALQRYWVRPYFGLWAPATYTAWLATAAIAPKHGQSLDPTIFHGLNLAIHVAASILVFLIVRRLVGGIWPAAAGAAVFAVHPIQVEAVAWVSGLRDVLAGAMSLAAIWIYFKATDAAGRARIWRIAIATLVFALALLSKPTAAVTPLLLAITLGKRARSQARWLSLWLVMAAADLVVAWVVQPSADIYRPPIWGRAIVALDALAFYFRKIVFPVHFLIDYGRSPDWLMAHRSAWWAAAAAALAVLALLLWRRRIPRLAAAAAIGICSLLPVLGLASFNFQYFSTVADRYAYLAMLGVAVGVAAVVAALPRGYGVFVALLIAALAVSANHQARVWRTTASLCGHTLATNPGSIAALLAFEALAGTDWQSVLQYNTRALQTKPDDPILLFDRASALRNAGRLSDAADAYARSLSRRPFDRHIRNDYAVLLAQQGNDAEAQRQFAELLRQAPDDAEARANWATYLALHGRRDQALTEFRRALAADPGCAAARRGIEMLAPKSDNK
ncbi:MAG: tetratricopeptide repeat protein [Tepidisphaeraceae bacterium]